MASERLGIRSNAEEDRTNIKCRLHKRCTVVDVNMICLKEGVPPGIYDSDRTKMILSSSDA